MYESPIEILIGKMQTKMDDDILKAVQAYHINVDKDELEKALSYDRDQYNKGYADAKRDAERGRGEWVYDGGDDEYADNIWKCSNCGHTWNFIGGYLSHPLDYEANYCPNCGADLRNSNARSIGND